jgi:hypothetical protein
MPRPSPFSYPVRSLNAHKSSQPRTGTAKDEAKTVRKGAVPLPSKTAPPYTAATPKLDAATMAKKQAVRIPSAP